MRTLFILLFVILLSLGCVNRSAPTENENGPGDYSFSLKWDNRTRAYDVHVPPSYNKTATPLVLAFHGGGGNVEGFIEISQLNAWSDQEGFIVGYPAGTGVLGNKLLTFNAGNCCGYAMENEVDDVGFVGALLDEMEKNFAIDSARIYATGFSNGGYFSYTLACDAELSLRIAAIAPVGGGNGMSSCTSSRNVPILDIKMKQDKCSLFEGGDECGGCLGNEKRPCASAQESLQDWVEFYSCDLESTAITYPDTLCSIHACGESEVGLCAIEGAGHQWPGGKPLPLSESVVGPFAESPIVNEIIWDFFQRHSLE